MGQAELTDAGREELLQRWERLNDDIVDNGESAEMRIRMANIHLKLEEREEAIMCLQTALQLRPGTPAVLSKLREICTEEEFANLDVLEEAEPFWRNVAELLRYPVSGSGIFLLIGGTIFVTVFDFLISLPTIFFFGGMILAAFLLGYLGSYFVSVMRSSAQGVKTPPDWPDITHIGDSILRPIFLISVPGIASFFPALIYLGYMIFADGPMYILVGLIALGALYYPMALIVSVITGAAMNSVVFPAVIASIAAARKEYFIAELTLGFFTIVSVMAHFMVSSIAGIPAGALIGGLASRFLSLYFMMIYARILGLLYRQCRSKIGL